MINKKNIIAISIILTLTAIMIYPGASAQDATSAFTIKFYDTNYAEDELPIKSFEYSEQNIIAGMAMKATRAEMTDILVTRFIDENSPILFVDCAKGRLIPEVTISVYYPGSQDPDVVINLKEVSVTSYTVVGEEGATPLLEGFTLGYNEISYSVADVTRGWDLVRNKQI